MQPESIASCTWYSGSLPAALGRRSAPDRARSPDRPVKSRACGAGERARVHQRYRFVSVPGCPRGTKQDLLHAIGGRHGSLPGRDVSRGRSLVHQPETWGGDCGELAGRIVAIRDHGPGQAACRARRRRISAASAVAVTPRGRAPCRDRSRAANEKPRAPRRLPATTRATPTRAASLPPHASTPQANSASRTSLAVGGPIVRLLLQAAQDDLSSSLGIGLRVRMEGRAGVSCRCFAQTSITERPGTPTHRRAGSSPTAPMA